MRNFFIKLSNIIIEKYQIIQYCSKIVKLIWEWTIWVTGWIGVMEVQGCTAHCTLPAVHCSGYDTWHVSYDTWHTWQQVDALHSASTCCHVLLHELPSTFAHWGTKLNVCIYIYKELNVETRISPRSSFRSVPFEKKESLLFRSVPFVRSWMPGTRCITTCFDEGVKVLC